MIAGLEEVVVRSDSAKKRPCGGSMKMITL